MESAIAAAFAEHIEDEDDSTRDLVQRVIDRDDDALNEFVGLHKRFVTSIIWSWVKNEDDLQDICQEIFIKACRALPGFRFQSNIRTWLASIAVNECRRFHARNRHQVKRDGTDIDSISLERAGVPDRQAEGVFARDLLDRIHETITKLPEETQLLFRLRFIEEMDSSEIARIMNIPAGTVRSRLFNLRNLLEERFGGGKNE
jgi:RNA polymerase sigma factor (sigma-70 family)